MIENKLRKHTKRIFNSPEEFIDFYKQNKGEINGVDIFPCESDSEKYNKGQSLILFDQKDLRERYFKKRKSTCLECPNCKEIVELTEDKIIFGLKQKEVLGQIYG